MPTRGRPFAVFDIDGTLIRWQLYHAIADNLVKLGFIAPVRFQAIKDARMDWKQRKGSESFKQYEMKLVQLYGEILSEITVDQFAQTTQAVFKEYKEQVYTYTRDLIAKLKDQEYLLFAISGSQSEIVEKITRHYGFDDFAAREDERVNGKFTGNSTTPIFSKDVVLKSLVKKHKAVFSSSIGVGDSVSDIKMLKLVDTPIVFNPEAKLFDYASKKDWKIVVERKNMVYELESKDGRYILAKTKS